jgi:hypothetical protein
MSKIVKGLMSANLAEAIRLARFGPRDLHLAIMDASA